MNPDELRALADALSRQRQADEHGIYCAVPRQAVDAAIRHLRAQADAQPVAWRCEVRGDGTNPAWDGFGWRHYNTTTSEREAQAFVARCGNGIEGRAVPLYAHPAPAVPQAEPKREPLSDERIDTALQTDPVLITRLMIGSMTVGEFRAALRRLARIVERALEIGGSDAGTD